MRNATAIGRLIGSVFLVALGCGSDGGGAGDDDVVGADADPNAPDADPDAPDGATSCADGLELCGGRCADLDTDSEHCGACDDGCSPGESCVGGDCATGVSALVISEVHAHAPAYFELYNGETAAIDLAGYQVQWETDGDTGSIVLPSYSLGPDEFVVLSEGTGEAAGGVMFLDAEVAWAGRAAVRLLAGDGIGVDFVRTGDSLVEAPTGTTWTGPNAANPGALVDQSAVRNVYAPDTDTSDDWSLTSPGSPGAYCARPGRCGDACLDFDADGDNCGGCGLTCGGAQLCLGGACGSGLVGLWVTEYRRFARPGVEIHNPTVNAIDMTGYRLDVVGPANLAYTFPAFTLAPGGFVFVYMGTGTDDATALFAGPSEAFGDDVAISLYDDGFTPLDFVRFGDSATPPPAGAAWFGANVPPPPMDEDSAARRDLQTFDTDGPADWIVESPSTPGFSCQPGLSMCNGGCAAFADDPLHCGACDAQCGANETCSSGVCSTVGTIVISELTNAGNERIELFNGGAAAVDLGGWRVEWIADSAGPGSFTIPAGVTLAAGAFVDLSEAAGPDTASTLFMDAAINWSTAIAVSLLDDAGAGIDFVRTGDSVTMPPAGTDWTGANAPNPSNSADEGLARQVYAPDTDAPDDWQLEAGTPAARCAPGASACGDGCADLATDAASCGACGNVCGTGGVCFAGACLEQGALRLAAQGGNGSSSGRLDVFDGEWKLFGYISGLDETDLGVACRQLGFGTGTYTGSSYSSDCCTGRIYSFACTGVEVRLVDCPHSEDSTASDYGVIASCIP
jgi:hypothetical protein